MWKSGDSMQTTSSTIDTTNIFYIKTFSFAYTIGANTYKELTATNFKLSTPTGYKVFSVSRFDTGANKVALCGILPWNDSGVVMRVKNMGTAITSNITASMTVVFVKDEFVRKQVSL